MNPPRAGAEDYTQHLIASPKAVSATQAAFAQPLRPGAPARDAFARPLRRLEPDAEALWAEVRPLVRPGGAPVPDDSVLGKPFARHVGLVGRWWPGRHRRVVRGIDPLTLLWTDGTSILPPCNYRLADPASKETRKTTSARCSRPRRRGAWPRPACRSAPGTRGLRASRRSAPWAGGS